MKPTEQLVEEHESITAMLDITAKVCDNLESGQEVPSDHLEQIVEFIREFADRCHHGKEEDLLFSTMEEAGFSSEEGPIAVMLSEHTVGRDYVKKMAEAATSYREGDRKVIPTFVDNARGFVYLLRDHIYKENNILYPMADSRLTDEDQSKLEREFQRVNEESIGLEKIEYLLGLKDKLKSVYRA